MFDGEFVAAFFSVGLTLVHTQITFSRTAIDDQVPAHNTTSSFDIVSRGVVDCSTYCFESSHCTCVFYSTVTGQCRGYSQHTVDNATFVPEPNVIHFDSTNDTQTTFISRQACEVNGYVYFTNPKMCIKIDQQHRLDWNASRHSCLTDNADLAILDTDAKIVYVSNYIKTNRNFNKWYVGMRIVNGIWKWVDSTTADPTKTPRVVTNQNCAILNSDNSRFGSLHCDDIKRYICEKK